MAQKYAYVGDGAIGSAIARNIEAAGFTPVVRFEEADFLVTMCLDLDQTEDAFFESGGAIDRLRKGAVVVDFGPGVPSLAREIQAMCAVSDLHAVEAPLAVHDVTRQDAYGARDNLCAFVAGDQDDVDLAMPLIQAVAASVRRCGQAGAGQLAKCACTLIQASQVVSLVEADALARAAGDDDADQMAQRIADAGFLPDSAMGLYRAIADEAFTGGSSVAAVMAELNCALDAAEESALIMPYAEAALSLFQLLSVLGGMDMNPAGLSAVYGDEDRCARFGLDWSRAAEVYGSPDDDEDDDYWDDEDDYSSN